MTSPSDHHPLPHILLIVTDQFRHDAFGPVLTPNLYKLATESGGGATFFSNAYASTPTCTPSRAALLTGKSPWHHGMLGYGSAVDCEQYTTTVPSVLAEYLGYETMAVGKNHFGTRPRTRGGKREEEQDDNVNVHNKEDATAARRRRKFITHGYQTVKLYDGLTEISDDYDLFFDSILPGVNPLSTCNLGWNDWNACPYQFDEYLHPTSWTTRQALNVIKESFVVDSDDDNDDDINNTNTSQQRQQQQRRKPMFLKVSYHRPHSPYDPPKRLWEKHLSRKEEPSYARNIGNSTTTTRCWDQEYRNNTEMAPDAWHGDPGEDAARRSRAGYLANVEFVDEGVGLLLEQLKSKENLFEDDVFIMWVSDHGDMNGDHNLWRKGYPWEESSHVNMMIKLPGRQQKPVADTISDAIVEIRDIAPTIYDFLGILNNVTNIDPLINGKTLLPIIKGTVTDVRDHLDLEHSTVYDERIHWNALVGKVRLGDGDSSSKLFKYIFFALSGTEQLFCLSDDPQELYDLAPVEKYESMLHFWRNSLIKQFREEGRGIEWVTKQGDLAVGRRGLTYGPHYPCHKQEQFGTVYNETTSVI